MHDGGAIPLMSGEGFGRRSASLPKPLVFRPPCTTDPPNYANATRFTGCVTLTAGTDPNRTYEAAQMDEPKGTPQGVRDERRTARLTHRPSAFFSQSDSWQPRGIMPPNLPAKPRLPACSQPRTVRSFEPDISSVPAAGWWSVGVEECGERLRRRQQWHNKRC